MRAGFASCIKGILSFTFIFLSSYYFSACGQTITSKSRIAIVYDGVKTNIWVSDFPKKTSVVITDSENNLLSIISTNDFGAAFLSLQIPVKKGVIAKTIDEEIIASNEVFLKNKQPERNIAVIHKDLQIKFK